MKTLNNASKTSHEVLNQTYLDAHMKTNYVYELLKQYVSLNEVIRRNEFRQEPFDHLNDDFKQLPFFLIKFPSGSEINIDHARDRSMLAITCDKAFLVLNENHLFQGMGLTKVSCDRELSEMLGEDLLSKLTKYEFISSLKEGKPTFSGCQ